ncbi:calpain-5-like isoform X1 [Gadus macrocephalus]|uniref:calpain-5-like isoform X1 n=1 Tax=Gadus macrocephalus TaxID=80720 RepID=UPI0028CB3B19|nr:calpain-5-like isoform X1 [Gadus macrocephalus]
MPERVQDFQGQSYHKLRRACRRRGTLFKDPLFPAAPQSLFYQREPPAGLTWKRPRELCKDPRLFVDGLSTRDLHQGSLGNCWMVAATSCLASEPTLWKKVIPDHRRQEWSPKRPDLYAGLFRFRFWRLGGWTEVVVDDRLPVGRDGALLFCRSATPREFWSALLEKAYAKLNGCYEALEGGNTAEALIDFTGGVSETLTLDPRTLHCHADQQRALYNTLSRANDRRALITCFIRPAEGEAVESVLDCGLVRGHAYGVTALRKVWKGDNLLSRNGMSRLLMIRMRNPWGTTDWTGTWSQRSDEWQQLKRPEREKMGIQVRDVGEFWMEFRDFCRYFTDVVLCRLVEKARLWSGSHWREESCFGEWAPAPGGSLDHGAVLRSRGPSAGPGPAGGGRRDGRQRGGRKEPRLGERRRAVARGGGKERVVKEKAGGAHEEEPQGRRSKEEEEEEESQSVEVEGEWGACVDKRSRCGGCINHMETFLHNPQFLLEVRGREEEVLICLQQEDRRRRRREGRGENLPIGFEVLKAKNSMPPCVWAAQVEVNRSSRVQCLTEQEASSIYMDSRSVTLRGTLPSGRYAVLPTTFLPGASGRFLLRVFSHAHLHLRELNEDLPSPSSFQCCLPEPWVVTTVHLQRAEVLSRTKYTAPDVYAVVRCEDRVVRTRVHEQNSSPEFNLRTIFYRRQPRAHISVELWSRGLILDTFLGTASLHTANSERGRSHVIDLRGGLSQRLGSQGCCVYVETSSSECLTDL